MNESKKMSKKAKIIISVLVIAIVMSCGGYLVYSYVNGNIFNPGNISENNDARKNDIDFDKEIDKIDDNATQESDKVNKNKSENKNSDKKDKNKSSDSDSSGKQNPKSKGKIFISSAPKSKQLAYNDLQNNNGQNSSQGQGNVTSVDLVERGSNTSDTVINIVDSNNVPAQNDSQSGEATTSAPSQVPATTRNASGGNESSNGRSTTNKNSNESASTTHTNESTTSNKRGETTTKSAEAQTTTKPSTSEPTTKAAQEETTKATEPTTEATTTPGGNANNNDTPATIIKPALDSISVPEKEEPKDAWDDFGMSLPTYDPSSGDNESTNLTLTVSTLLPTDYINPSNKIYKGEPLSDETILNQVLAYAGPTDDNGEVQLNQSYRLRNFNENFFVKDYPERAYDGFTATFCFRATRISPWQEQTVSFETVSRKMVVLTYEEGVWANYNDTIDMLYPDDGQKVNILRFYNSVCDKDNDLTMLYRGWSDTLNGEPIDTNYVVENEGLIFLYPAGYVELGEEFKEKLVSQYDGGTFSFEWLQTLYDYTGTSKTLKIPEYTFSVQLENKHTFDKVVIPSTLKKISLKDKNGNNSLIVNDEYVVADDNKYYSTLDGMLTSKEQDKIYDIPKNKTNVTFDENIKAISIRVDSKIEEMHLSSVIPEMNIENLNNAKIYVPRNAYYDYLAKYGSKLGTNELLCDEETDIEPEYIYVDGAIYSKDSSVLYSISDSVKGTFIVPSCVKMIAEGAMDNCPDVDTLIFTGNIDLFEENSIDAKNLDRIYFLGKEKVPVITSKDAFVYDEDDCFPLIYVQQSLYDDFNEMWSYIFGEDLSMKFVEDNLEIKEVNDYKYLDTNEGAMLLKCATLDREFKADTLKDVYLVEIGANAFAGNENIRYITLPDTVTVIGKCAFKDCINLESVYVPSSDYITVNANAFTNDKALRFCAFDALVGTFDEAFTNEKNTGIFFAPYNAYGYDTEHTSKMFSYYTPYGVPYIVKDAGDGKILYAYAEDGMVDPYTDGYILCKATSEVSGDIELIDQTLSIEYKAFYKCHKPFTLSNLDTLDIIAEMAFSGSGLEGEYNFPNLYFAQANAFEGCSGITRLQFGTNFYDAGYALFESCRNLKEVEFETTYAFSLSSLDYLQPYTFGNNIGTDCGGFKIVLSEWADVDSFIDKWKYYMLGKDIFYDYGNLTEEEDIKGQNLVRALFGLDPITELPEQPELPDLPDFPDFPDFPDLPDLPETQNTGDTDNSGETENPDNQVNENSSGDSSNAFDNKTDSKDEDENYITVNVSELLDNVYKYDL